MASQSMSHNVMKVLMRLLSVRSEVPWMFSAAVAGKKLAEAFRLSEGTILKQEPPRLKASDKIMCHQ